LMQTYPWIMDVVIDDESSKNLNRIKRKLYVDIVVNTYMLQQQTGWELYPWFISLVKNKPLDGGGINIAFDISYEEAKEVKFDIIRAMNAVSKSSSLPEKYKLPPFYEGWSVDNFIFPSHKQLPPPKTT